MKFCLLTVPAYLLALAGGLGLPGLVVLQRDALQWLDVLIYGAALLLLVVSVFALCLLVARAFFPEYWWMGQVEGQDVFEFDGVYFIGLRLTRIPNRMQRIVFGVDDQMRRWDILFGLLFLVLLVPHLMGFTTMHRVFDRVLPDPARFPESLHYTMLSHLPVMREWDARWTPRPAVARRVDQAIAEMNAGGLPGVPERFRLAQLYLLDAFTLRDRASDPFSESPGERIYFNRGRGARAVEQLEVILALPELQRAGWSGGVRTLIGFFHLCDGDYEAARVQLEQAVAELGQADESGISRYQALLLAAQAALLTGNEVPAITHLERIMLDERLPREAYALALEHYADALRLMGRHEKAPELLAKARELYDAAGDRGGLARVHLRRAALALDQGRHMEASRELSMASSLAYSGDDGFALNMVERLALAFAG